MKFFSITKKTNKASRRTRALPDFYQESVNNYGKKQMKSLIDRGLGVQWR